MSDSKKSWLETTWEVLVPMYNSPKTRWFLFIFASAMITVLSALALKPSNNNLSLSRPLEESGTGSIPWVDLSFTLVVVIVAFVSLSNLGKTTTGPGKKDEKKDEKKDKPKGGTKWIDQAKGPIGLLIIWIGVLVFIHYLLYIQWTDIWVKWENQSGLFYGFNLTFLGSVFFFRQKFQGTWPIGAFLGIMAIFSIISALPERAEASRATVAVVSLSEQEWRYKWTVIDGQTRQSLKSMSPLRAVVHRESPNILDFTVHWSGDGLAHFVLDRSMSDTGTWRQSSPEDSGVFTLTEETTGRYSGVVTDINGSRSTCVLWRTR